MGYEVTTRSNSRVAKVLLGALMSLVVFFGSPGAIAVAQEIVDQICGTSVQFGPDAYIASTGGAFPVAPVYLEVSVDGATSRGYCVDYHLDYPSGECSAEVAVEEIPGGAACVAINYPPVNTESYSGWLQAFAGQYATWNLMGSTDLGIASPEQAMADSLWDVVAANLEETWGITGEQAQEDLYEKFLEILNACAGAGSVAVPSMVSLGDESGVLPENAQLTVAFQTNFGSGVTVNVSVSDATLITPASGIAVTDDSGVVYVTVEHNGTSAATITATATSYASAGVAVGSVTPGVQRTSVSSSGVIPTTVTASAEVTWTEAPTATPTEAPTETPTATPTEEPAETPTATPTEAPAETPTAAPTEAPAETPTATPIVVPTKTPEKNVPGPGPVTVLPATGAGVPDQINWIYGLVLIMGIVAAAGALRGIYRKSNR